VPLFSDYLLDLKGLWFNPSLKEVGMDISTLQPMRQPESCYLFTIGTLVLLLDACLLNIDYHGTTENLLSYQLCSVTPPLCILQRQSILALVYGSIPFIQPNNLFAGNV